MVSVEQENLITLRAAARLVPSSRGGKSGIHVATVYRWTNKGVRGQRLETILVGGIRYTSEAALWRFVGKLNEKENPLVPPPQRDSKRAGRTKSILKKAGLCT